MNKHFSSRVDRLNIVLALSFGCCSAAFAQGIPEYAGVMSIPKPIPKTSGAAGALNAVYGAPGRAMAGATAGSSGSSAARGSSPAASSSKSKKAGKPAVIMSGDLPGSQIQAQRAAVLGISKIADESYHGGLEAKKKGKLPEAEALFRKSVLAREQYWSDRDHMIPDIYVLLGEINDTRKEDKKSVEDLQKALAYYSKFYGPGSDHRLKPLLLMSEVQARLGEKVNSYDSYKQAYELAKRAKLDQYNPVELRLTTIKMALGVEKYRDAIDMCELATSTSEKPKMSQDQYVSVMNDYATALRGLNRTRDADEVLAEVEKIKAGGGSSTPEKPDDSATK